VLQGNSGDVDVTKQKQRYNSALSTSLDEGERSERGKLDRRRSTELTLLAAVGGCFLALVVRPRLTGMCSDAAFRKSSLTA